ILQAYKTKSSLHIQSNYPFSVSHPSTDSVTNASLAFEEADNDDINEDISSEAN
ncbi:15532_t:CDS:1, partial [Cetraspora pellucida]